MNINNAKIAVLGLGYVGLPLAVEFAKQRPVLAFDISDKRIAELQSGHDRTREVGDEELTSTSNANYSCNAADLADCNVYIVTVPTPIDASKAPDLRPISSACVTIGAHLAHGDVVIFESTVYPGCTEEHCAPILARESGLAYNKGFFLGYSPERMNPGDKAHTVKTIIKVTSGSTPEIAEFVDNIYASIVTAGTHKATSIKVAEAAKVIENTQRDVNVALVNELAVLFYRLGIDTLDVLETAGTKWNFLPFRPGLVGGHCIGVDPYYLTYKAQSVGHHAEMILAGRRINDAMGGYIADNTIKLMLQKGQPVVGSRILILGLTFKEDTPDLRNTRVVDIINQLRSYNATVDVHDPWADPQEAQAEYGISLVSNLQPDIYDAAIIAVGHDQFHELGTTGMRTLLKPNGVLLDIKSIFPAQEVDARL